MLFKAFIHYVPTVAQSNLNKKVKSLHPIEGVDLTCLFKVALSFNFERVVAQSNLE